MQRARFVRDPRAWVLAATVVSSLIGLGWGLPNSDTWAADSVSPRACALGAVAETYLPGHFHHYGPLHLLLLQVLSLPWVIAAAARVGTDRAALEQALIQPATMTAIEVIARLVSTAMLAGIVALTMRLWERLASRRAGIAAGVIVATNSVFVYYAHTGNLEIPYLAWTMVGFVAIDRVLAGEDRVLAALLAIIAATVTKDQAAASFLLVVPACVIARPDLVRSARTWRAAGIATLAYAVGSGMLVNPVGYARHVALIFGPASRDWAMYPRTLGGRIAQLGDFVLSVPRYTSWPIAIAAAVGVVLAVRTRRGVERWRVLMPLIGATSFAVFATFNGQRAEDRFSLPEALLFFPYAALVFDAVAARVERTGRGGWAFGAACAIALAPAVLAVASVDATLIADPRYEVERFLAGLPAGTRVEVYGGPRFLPRMPPNVAATRVGTDDPSARTRLPWLTELRDRPANVVTRRPDYVVLSTEFSRPDAATPGAPRYGVTSYNDADAAEFFRALFAGELGYDRVLTAKCEVPWPLACRRIHGSTGEEVWVYRRRDETIGAKRGS